MKSQIVLAMLLYVWLLVPHAGASDEWYLATVDQEQNARLDALEARLDAFEGRLRVVPDVELPRDPAPLRRTVRQSTTTKVVPSNHHAHYAHDGRVVIHHDSNNGVPGAHDGMSRIRIAEAGQVIGDCPNGNCPTRMSTRYQSTFRLGKPNGPFAGIGRALSGRR